RGLTRDWSAWRVGLLAGGTCCAPSTENDFRILILAGGLRQVARDGVMDEAIAAAAGVPSAEVRRALMLRGSLGPVATAALADGVAGVRAFTLEVGRPVKPMLAASAPTVDEAFAKLGAEAAVEWKLDGIRAQIHVSVGEVRVFTRTLDEITSRLPEVVEAVRGLPVRAAVL